MAMFQHGSCSLGSLMVATEAVIPAPAAEKDESAEISAQSSSELCPPSESQKPF